jgi:ABC-type uncharacterized transport system involved in gliding motility auxiliary subunit
MTQKRRKLAFTTGHGEGDLSQGFQALKQELEQEYETTTVNPSSAEIGADVDALVVGGPKQAFDEKGQQEIDKFLMKGKGATFLIDGMAMQAPHGGNPEMQIKMASPTDTGLSKQLETYGFKVEQNFVFDRQAMPGPVDLGGRRMLTNAPMFIPGESPKATDLSVLEGIRGVIFPYASSVEKVGPLAGNKLPTGAKLWTLASSSKESWKHTGFFVLSAGMKFEPSKDVGAFALGYAYQGVLKSAFAAPQAVAESSADKAAPPPSESAKPVRLVVIGDSDFANDEYVQLARVLPFYGAGAQLLLNAISWTVEDEAMTPLRSKGQNARPLTIASEGAATALQWGNIVGLPVAFCLFGLVRWRIRRTQRLGLKL